MENIIEMKNLCKSYYMDNWDEIPVLNWIDLQIKKNEFIAIMWESWWWKSTLLNIIWFLHRLTSWEYFLEWDNISEIKDDNTLSFIRNKKIGFIFQQFYLLPRLNAVENVSLPSIYAWFSRAEREKNAIFLLNKLWLWNKLNSYPWELSWWQQQRVAIARALVNNPEILLADEPTWNLDSKTTSEVMQIVKGLKDSWKTVVMVTHTKTVASYADRVIFLRDWKIVDQNYKL